jgi:hypothetical protein
MIFSAGIDVSVTVAHKISAAIWAVIQLLEGQPRLRHKAGAVLCKAPSYPIWLYINSASAAARSRQIVETDSEARFLADIDLKDGDHSRKFFGEHALLIIGVAGRLQTITGEEYGCFLIADNLFRKVPNTNLAPNQKYRLRMKARIAWKPFCRL